MDHKVSHATLIMLQRLEIPYLEKCQMNCLLSSIHTGTPLDNAFLILVSSFERSNPFPANLVHQHHDQKDHQANHRHDTPDTETLAHPRQQSLLHVLDRAAGRTESFA